MKTIAFRTAKNEVHRYRLEFRRFKKLRRSIVGGPAEYVPADRPEAIERRDCEDFLQLGVEAFRWLQKARESYQEDVYSGLSEYSDDTERQITELYEQWLKPCTAAERWIVDLQDRGFPPGNSGEFRGCCLEAAAALEERRMVEVARRARM
jgi:hypothetical protein